MVQIFGIDYGSKLAGTTAVARLTGGEVSFFQSAKSKSADDFIIRLLDNCAGEGDLIALDAPLSLPLVYSEPNPLNCKSADFHYRVCDREVNAMSPLFLGGLTARAMSLTSKLVTSGLNVYEVYPKMVAWEEGFKNLYDKRKGEADVKKILTRELVKNHDLQLCSSPDNLHALDALLAMIGGLKIHQNRAAFWGDVKEGLIYG